MSKKNQSSDEEIWSKRFDEEQEDLEYVSRSERTRGEKRNNDEGMSPMLTGTVIFLAVLILATIFYYVWYSNRPVNQSSGPEDPEIEEVGTIDEDESDSEEEPDSETEPEADQEETESEPEAESEPEVEPEAEPEPEVAPEPEPEPEPAPEVESEPAPAPPVDEGETYIVQPGDNMYRIALNHGMSTEELMALNNLADETVYVGQELRVE